MGKKRSNKLKLLTRAVDKLPFGEWDFVWATTDELDDFYRQGYVWVKKVKLLT